VLAPVTRAVDVRSANPVAARRRHAIDARPDEAGGGGDCRWALLRQSAQGRAGSWQWGVERAPREMGEVSGGWSEMNHGHIWPT
jgi:hypothetical protein